MRVTRFSIVLLALATACTPPSPSQADTSESPTAKPAPSLSVSIPTASPLGGATLSLAAIQRLDPRAGYIAGLPGTGVALAKTNDAGATWQPIAIPASYLNGLRFIDERVGWVAGVACGQAGPTGFATCRGVVLRTEDGGGTWQEALSGPTAAGSYPIPQLQAVDGQIAWVLTQAPSCCLTDLRRTTDGGRTWTTLLSSDYIAAIRFASASQGWAALDDRAGTVTVRATTDGGTTWSAGFRTASGQAVGLDAATTQTAWLLTRNGGYCTASNCSKFELFRTVDGGLGWSSVGNPKDFACSGGHLAGPLFASVARGWLGINLGAGGVNVGPGGLLTTEDGGNSWQCMNIPPNPRLVSAADPLHVWVTSDDRITIGAALYASDDGGKSWRKLDLGSTP